MTYHEKKYIEDPLSKLEFEFIEYFFLRRFCPLRAYNGDAVNDKPTV